MRLPWLFGAVSMVVLAAGQAEGGGVVCTAPPTDEPRAFRRITTPFGSFRIRLFDRPGEAPNTVANFLTYTDFGDYDQTFFHRLVPNGVLQGGGFTFDPLTSDYDEVPQRPPITNEPGICNVAGTLAMARPVGGGANSATSQWFINLADNTEPFGAEPAFTVFAQVFAQDMGIVNQIGALHREFGTLLIDDPIAPPELADETFANVPVLEIAERPPEGWGCIGSLSPDPALVVIPPIPFPVWLPEIEDNCGGDPVAEQAARDLMRADMGPKINELLIWTTVPEPGAAGQSAAALSALALAGLGRRSRRRDAVTRSRSAAER
jgi:MYXO-CTERM domain-containing protein